MAAFNSSVLQPVLPTGCLIPKRLGMRLTYWLPNCPRETFIPPDGFQVSGIPHNVISLLLNQLDLKSR